MTTEGGRGLRLSWRVIVACHVAMLGRNTRGYRGENRTKNSRNRWANGPMSRLMFRESPTSKTARRATGARSVAPWLGWAAASLLFIVLPSQAHAWRTTNDLPDFDNAAGWRRAMVSLEVVEADGLVEDVEAAALVWQSSDCAAPSIRTDDATTAARLGDGQNTVELLADSLSFPDGVAAVTDLVYRETADADFEITEADIRLNGPFIEENALDRRLVLAHEIGHLFGLLHPCELSSAPRCGDDPTDALLDPRYGDIGMSLPTSDDLGGLCEIYPPCVEACGDAFCVGGECTMPMCTCPDGRMCTDDGECPSPARGGLGDACTSSVECRTGLCSSTGHCAEPCTSGRCGARHECVRGVCTSARATFGESCVGGEDCVTGVCLDPGENGALRCTRDCGLSCPEGADCDEVDARLVCVVAEPTGCVVSFSSRGDESASVLLILFVLWRRRRRSER